MFQKTCNSTAFSRSLQKHPGTAPVVSLASGVPGLQSLASLPASFCHYPACWLAGGHSARRLPPTHARNIQVTIPLLFSPVLQAVGGPGCRLPTPPAAAARGSPMQEAVACSAETRAHTLQGQMLPRKTKLPMPATQPRAPNEGVPAPFLSLPAPRSHLCPEPTLSVAS